MKKEEGDLIEWSEWQTRRDLLVRRAYEAGVPKLRIHEITGVARTTIDRILRSTETTVKLVVWAALYRTEWTQGDSWEVDSLYLHETDACGKVGHEITQPGNWDKEGWKVERMIVENNWVPPINDYIGGEGVT